MISYGVSGTDIAKYFEARDGGQTSCTLTELKPTKSTTSLLPQRTKSAGDFSRYTLSVLPTRNLVLFDQL